jgi:hypothetical protein
MGNNRLRPGKNVKVNVAVDASIRLNIINFNLPTLSEARPITYGPTILPTIMKENIGPQYANGRLSSCERYSGTYAGIVKARPAAIIVCPPMIVRTFRFLTMFNISLPSGILFPSDGVFFAVLSIIMIKNPTIIAGTENTMNVVLHPMVSTNATPTRGATTVPTLASELLIPRERPKDLRPIPEVINALPTGCWGLAAREYAPRTPIN